MTGAEVVAAAKAAQQVESALVKLLQVTGVDAIAQQATGTVADSLYYRREVRRAKLIMGAAEKIRAAGIPPHAVSDPVLRAVLEDGGDTDDATLQEMWENLLVSDAVTDGVPAAYPYILRTLDPVQVKVLQALTSREEMPMGGRLEISTSHPIYYTVSFPANDTLEKVGEFSITEAQVEHLAQQGLLRSGLEGISELGLDFVRVCTALPPAP